MTLFKKTRLLDSDDEVLEQVSVLLANAGQQYRTLPRTTIAVALGRPPSTISRCLNLLRERGLATADRDRPAVWGATSDLMDSWRFSRHPRLYHRRAGEGFNACTVCGSPNKEIVRFCTFCGLEVRSSTDSIEAGRRLRHEEAQAAGRVGIIGSPDGFDRDDGDDGFTPPLTEGAAM